MGGRRVGKEGGVKLVGRRRISERRGVRVTIRIISGVRGMKWWLIWMV